MSRWMKRQSGPDGMRERLILDGYSILRAVLVPGLLILNHWINLEHMAYQSRNYDVSFWLILLTFFVVPILLGIVCNLEGLLKALRFRRFKIELGCCVGFLITLILCLIMGVYTPILAMYCLFIFLFGIVNGAEEELPRRTLR